MKIDWIDVWNRMEVEGSASIEHTEQDRIEQLVNEQIEAQEEQYPELAGLPPADAMMEKKIIEAGRKASRTGSVADLAEYMKLRKER